MAQDDEDGRNRRLQQTLASVRFRSAWSRMDEADHSDRMAALEGVRRLLSKSGFKMQDVLAFAQLVRLADEARQPTSRQADPKPSRSRARAAKPRAGTTSSFSAFRPIDIKPLVQGQAVPNIVVGKVQTGEVSQIGRATMMFIRMEDAVAVYDPLVASDAALIEVLQSASEADATIRAVVEPPADVSGNARITRASIIT